MKTVAVISTDVGLPLRGTVGTVVVFDLWCITHLDLYDDRLSEKEYTTLFSLITFPVLTKVNLFTYKINCVDLGAFLLRQPLLSVLNCSSYGRLYEVSSMAHVLAPAKLTPGGGRAPPLSFPLQLHTLH
jgi:hypothetical protein